MAELYRVTRLDDPSKNQTFTFLLPPATSADTPPEISSRDFLYAGHRWRLSLLKKDKHLSPYLVCTNLARGLKCCLDFSMVLISRESFSQNESFTDKEKLFENTHCSAAVNLASEKLSAKRPDQTFTIHEPANSHGRRTFITLMDLKQRSFANDRGDYLLEVNVKNPRSTFEYGFQLNKPKFDSKSNASILDYQRYDSNVFTYGDMEWHCTFCPNMEVSYGGKLRHMIQIVRKNKTELLCRLSYQLTLGPTKPDSKSRPISYRRQEIFDFAGNGQSSLIYFERDYCDLLDEHYKLKLTVDLYSLTILNQLRFALDKELTCDATINGTGNSPRLLSSKNNGKFGKLNTQTFLDKDKQTWSLSLMPTFSRTNLLTVSLIYVDCQNIPKNYSRYVSWNINILPADKMRNSVPIRPLVNKSTRTAFEKFYTQVFPDKGYSIRMDTNAQELQENATNWLDDLENRFTVEIEWLDSYLLFQPFYSMDDDLYRKQVAQMRREISALQLENSDLEKEMFKYQISISKKFSPNNANLISQHESKGQTTPNPQSWSICSSETDEKLVQKTLLGDRDQP